MAGVHRDTGHVRRARGQADHHPKVVWTQNTCLKNIVRRPQAVKRRPGEPTAGARGRATAQARAVRAAPHAGAPGDLRRRSGAGRPARGPGAAVCARPGRGGDGAGLPGWRDRHAALGEQAAAVPGDADLTVVAGDDLAGPPAGRVPRWASRTGPGWRRRARPGPPRRLALPEAISSSRASGAPFSIEGIHRWCAIGWALTKPLSADGSRSVTTAWARRRSAAASVPGEPAARRDPRRGPAERVRPGLVDRPELLRIALVQAAHQGEVGVHPDVDAARVHPARVAAPHHGEALPVLGPDRIQQLLARLAARLPVGPDQRHGAGVLAARAPAARAAVRPPGPGRCGTPR